MIQMDNDSAVIVLTTWPASADPAPFATALVEENLAACVNVLREMGSVFRWQGRVERERERQVFIKTTRERLGVLEARLAALHPYEVPEILVLPIVGGSAGYLAWLSESLPLL